MADRSPSMRGHFSPEGTSIGSTASTSASAGPGSSADSQVPQPHSRRPPSGTDTISPHVRQRILGMATSEGPSTKDQGQTKSTTVLVFFGPSHLALST